MPGFTRAFPELRDSVNDCLRCQTPIPGDAQYCSHCPPDYTYELGRRLAQTLDGRYQIIRLLGRGGMAAVFLAQDLVLERQVAIKVLPPDMTRDGELITRFQREAKTAARLDHPSIIPIHRVESEAGLVYIVMKYVSGQSLEELLVRGRLPVPQVRHILREAALALGHAHRRHVIHRDVKPANIMLDNDSRVVLTDFGISKAVEGTTQLTGTGTIIGTPAYMAPEQVKGRGVDGRADQYSLAIVGYRALTGRLPFEGDPHSILYQQVHEPPPSLKDLRPDTPRDLERALERALAKESKARFPTMEEFAASVSGERGDSLGAGTTTVVSVSTRSWEQPGPRGTHGSGVFVAIGTLVLVIGIAVFGIPRLQHAVDQRSKVRPVPSAPGMAPPVSRSYALLSVRSTPRGILYLDGIKVGLTPITNRLTTGTHRLRVEQRGYRPITETIVIRGTRPVSRHYELQRQTGR
jgi:serine/threonine protein kinase